MREKIGKWLIRTGARILGRGMIVTIRGSIVVPTFGDEINLSWEIIGGGGGGGPSEPQAGRE